MGTPSCLPIPRLRKSSDSFETLYSRLPLLDCGYTKEDVDTASPDDMDAYYPKELQQKYGVVGIKVALWT